MKLLLVDDEPDIRRIARLALERIGKMQVVEADSGSAALLEAVRAQPDAILLDVVMPDRDGPSVLGELRGDPRSSGIPVVFLTAKAMPAEVERLMGLGAVGVLTKPFDPMRLAMQVRDLILPTGATSAISAATGISSLEAAV